ncbi:hypothetical protein [Halomonas mongoliensis]|uniref:hypothetical protein n=1 Tax=Halomonas mongoliensis TaxID=321265 RepID=UPI00403B1555
MNIVIVTYNWPPRNAIGTHRPYAWARYWSELGVNVTVLTAQKQSFDDPLDLYLPRLDNVDVFEVLKLDYLSPAGWLLKFPVFRQFARKIKPFLGHRSAIVNDPRMAWRQAAKAKAVELAVDADVVVSTFGPASAHLIGYDMKIANPSLFWVADYRDLWSQRHTNIVSSKVLESLIKLEKDTVGAYADVLVSVSKDLVEQLESFLGKEVLELPNGFDIDERLVRSTLAERPGKPDGPFRIVYTGKIYEGYQDPTPLLDAVAALYANGEVGTGELTVDFYGSRVDLAKKLAKNPRYAPFTRVMGHVTRQEALSIQRSAGLLLLLESPLPEARGVLTGKLFEYITAGTPVLCVGSRPEYEIGNVLKNTGTGQVFGPDEYGKLKKVVLETFSGNGLYESYSPNVDEVLKFSRRRQAQNFLQFVLEKASRQIDLKSRNSAPALSSDSAVHETLIMRR